MTITQINAKLIRTQEGISLKLADMKLEATGEVPVVVTNLTLESVKDLSVGEEVEFVFVKKA